MADHKRIEPKILKGFRDYLPEMAISRNHLLRTIEKVFLSFGFLPIDTPALEYSEILLGKGSAETDKQLFRFLDNGDRDVALRFDLTVPLARFVAMHAHELALPFKRYHIAPVWRAEKPQRGRYREFMQCDVDIVGVHSALADAEILLAVHQVLKRLNLSHLIRVNSRELLNGFLKILGADAHTTRVLRAIDKLEKLGIEVVKEELASEADLPAAKIEAILAFITTAKQEVKPLQLVEELRAEFHKHDAPTSSCDALQTLFSCLEQSGLPTDSIKLDLGIARGLDYYTGMVFETNLKELPDIGSICSGGRYDNLVSVYSKLNLSGVGASFGLDRLLAALEELGKLPKRQSTAEVMVTVLDPGTEAKCAAIAQLLRDNEIATELYPEAAKLGNQLKHANKKGIRFVVICGKNEIEKGTYSLKDMLEERQIDNIPLEELPARLKKHTTSATNSAF